MKCRMYIRLQLSGEDNEVVEQFLEHCLSHLISGAMADSGILCYELDDNHQGHVSYPKEITND